MIINGKVINPGELRTTIELEKRTVVQQPGGFDTLTWISLGEPVKARWRNAHGLESEQASAQGYEALATVLLRYNSEVDTTCSILKSGVRFEIVSIDNIQERGEFLELKVKHLEGG